MQNQGIGKKNTAFTLKLIERLTVKVGCFFTAAALLLLRPASWPGRIFSQLVALKISTVEAGFLIPISSLESNLTIQSINQSINPKV
jgi:hypothetical protein